MATIAYNLILIVVRLIAISQFLYSGYLFLLTVIPLPGRVVSELSVFMQAQTRDTSLRNLIVAAVLYYIAPWIAWAATRALKDNREA